MIETMIKINDTEISVKRLFCTLLSHFNKENSNLLEVLRSLTLSIKDEELSLTEMVDVGYLLRGMEIILDEMRKDVKAHKERIGRATCHSLALIDELSFKGTLATGTAKATFHSQIPHPKHQSEAFAKVCEWFNIDIGEGPVGVMRLHWPTIRDYITNAMEKGEELPPELSDIKADLEMTYRRRANGKED